MSVKSSNTQQQLTKQLSTAQQPVEKSFLEIGQWKRATERIVQGNESLNNLSAMIQERATLEKKYSADLQKWSLKFSKIINKSAEYNSTRHAWMESLDEAVKLADMHTTVADSLEQQSLKKVQNFQKENYKKKLMGGFKQVQRYEKDFGKAQKTWEDLYKKQHKAGNDYYAAINSRKSSEKELKSQTMNLEQASSTGANVDRVKQKIDVLKGKLEKAEQLVNDNRGAYQKAVDTCTSEKDRYVDDMKTVYGKTQLDEEKRLKFVRDVLFDVHQRIDLASIDQFKRIYEDHQFSILKLDVEADIQWWHNTKGMGVMMQWPQFEEYNTESLEKTLSYKQSVRGKNQVPGASNITTMTYKQRNSFSQEFEKNDEEVGAGDKNHYDDVVSEESGRAGNGHIEEPAEIENNNNMPASPMKGILPILPAESDVEAEVLVEAVYTYEAAEQDEINLQPGLRFIQIQAEDDQGWCKGRLENGSEGLYPANYVKAL